MRSSERVLSCSLFDVQSSESFLKEHGYDNLVICSR